MAERCKDCRSLLIPDTCTNQWMCIYCNVEKIEQRERSTEHRSTARDMGTREARGVVEPAVRRG